MRLRNPFTRRAAPGPEGVAVRVRSRPRRSAAGSSRSDEGRIPPPLLWGLVLAAAFYVLAHLSVVWGVWPVHGSSPGAGATLLRDATALVGWLALIAVLRASGFRGSWGVVILPILIFFLVRPAIFSVFTDPAYQATSGTRTEMNQSKATLARISTAERAYDEERARLVFGGEVPDRPDPLASAVREATQADRGAIARGASFAPVLLAPLALLLGFWLARRSEWLRRFREHRLVPFAVTLGVFFVLTLFFTELGKVGGTTPWELFLPIFVAVWAATLADDAYNLARPGEVVDRRRLLGLFLYGAAPVLPFLVIRELGLSIVLAGSLAAMLLVGTRRGWWAGLMLGIWAVLVFVAFNLDERSATRLELAYNPYPNPSEMAPGAAETWAAKLHQVKLFDANVLEGGIVGEGPGRGHAETAPNAADDGYITLVAAQWGWLGALAIVLLYTAFLTQMLGVALRERGAFERTLVTGLAMLIAIPFWLATLGGIRVIPLTGVAAAFAANGGAKLLAASLGVGIIAGISHRRASEERLEGALAAPAPASAPLQGVRIR